MGQNRVTILMYVVGFLDLFGVSMVIPLLSKHARELGASPTMVGFLGSVYGGLQLMSSPIIGQWSDQAGRRLVMVWCMFLSALGYAMLGVSTTVIFLLLARIPPGIFKHSQELAKAFLADSTPADQHSTVFGRFNAVSSMGFIVGPAIGGHIADLPGGFRTGAMVTASTFLLNGGLFKHTQNFSKAYIAEIVPSARRAHVLGQYNAVSSMGFIVGPVVGGHLGEWSGGFYFAALFNAAVFLVNTVLVWYYVPASVKMKVQKDKEDTRKEDGETKQKKSDSRGYNPLEFISFFRRLEWNNLWDIFLIRFLLGAAVIVYRSNFSMFLDYKYNASAKVTGYLISYSGIIGTISGFLVGKIAYIYQSDNKLLLHAGIIQFLTILMISFASNLWMLVICLTPLSLANAVARVCSTNLTIERGKGHDTGALLGVGASILSMARMLGPIAGGLSQEYHISGPAILGSILAGLGVLTLIIVPHDQQRVKLKAN